MGNEWLFITFFRTSLADAGGQKLSKLNESVEIRTDKTHDPGTEHADLELGAPGHFAD